MEFYLIIRDIISTKEFQQMKKYRHHVKGSLYAHSIKVAYLCYKHHKRFHMKVDINEFVIGALLHDYYLYDRHSGNVKYKYHWARHPRRALRNALRRYPNLTYTQKDMILHHMFPVTPIYPKTAAGWVLCFYDKVVAVNDYFGKNRIFSD